MTPLPVLLGGNELVGWRLDVDEFRDSWDAGEGAYIAGGRWNSKGVRAVYCSIDPGVAILELAAHKGFKALDTVPHVLTAFTISDPADVYVVGPEAIPVSNWLSPGIPSARQQAFGDTLLAERKFTVIPSAVSSHSWNLIFVKANVAASYAVKFQEPFVLDPRLHRASR